MVSQNVPEIAHALAMRLQHGEPDRCEELSLKSVCLDPSAPLMKSHGAAILYGPAHAAARRPVAADERREQVVARHLIDGPCGDPSTLDAQDGPHLLYRRITDRAHGALSQRSPNAEKLPRSPDGGETLAQTIKCAERRFGVPHGGQLSGCVTEKIAFLAPLIGESIAQEADQGAQLFQSTTHIVARLPGIDAQKIESGDRLIQKLERLQTQALRSAFARFDEKEFGHWGAARVTLSRASAEGK